MTFRFPAVAAVCGLLGLAAGNTASAQPIAPPARPTFSGYGAFFRPGAGGYYGYGGGGPGAGAYGGFGYGGPGFGYGGGFGGPGFGFGGLGAGGVFPQNGMLGQMATTTQNLATLQSLAATGVNTDFPITGRGAVYSYLGHWYPTSRYGGVGGGMGLGGMGAISAPRTSGSSGAAAAAGGAGGSNAGKTAGSGIPIGAPQQRR